MQRVFIPKKQQNLFASDFNTDFSQLFRRSSYLDELTLFTLLFKTVPIVIEENHINCKSASEWFSNHYQQEIKDCFYNQIYFGNSPKSEIDDLIYILEGDLIVQFDTQQKIARFLFKNTDYKKVESMIKEIKSFNHGRIQKSKISLIVNSKHGIETKTFSIKKPKLKLEDNYNDDFIEVHRIIVKRLKQKNDKGLVLLHGKAGTGKTSYIRYLAATIRKNVIFLPPNMASAITNPNLIGLLIDNPNSVFVIEDAENIIVDREKEGKSPVSALLNISDGLLSDCLNIQIICSFNTDISKVDSALLRKGRLIAKYEFRELELQKANALSQKLGFENMFQQPATLTDIYNQVEKEFQKTDRKRIGF